MTISSLKLPTLIAILLLAGACTAKTPTPSPQNTPSVTGQSDSLTITRRRNHRQGPLKASPGDLNWAIDGPGYFVVRDSKDGKAYYTRNGAFKYDAPGQIISQQGHLLDPAVAIQHADDYSHISEGGTVWSKQAGKDTVSENARVSIVLFEKPEALKALGGRDGLFEATAAAGRPQTFQPKQNGAGFIIQGALEDFSDPPVSLPDSGCQAASSKLETTGNKMDWLIEGQGFFTFLDPATGEHYYSRRASIKTDANGQLISAHGYLLEPAVTLPPDQELDRIDVDGSIWSTGPKDGHPFKLGSVYLSLIEKPEVLVPLGFSRGSIYLAPAAAGKISSAQAGTKGTGTLKSGVLENCAQEIIGLPAGLYGKLPALNLAS